MSSIPIYISEIVAKLHAALISHITLSICWLFNLFMFKNESKKRTQQIVMLIETLVRKWVLMRMLIGPRFGECIRGRMEKGKRMMRWQRIHQNSTI